MVQTRDLVKDWPPGAKLIVSGPDDRRGSILQWYSGPDQCADCIYSTKDVQKQGVCQVQHI